MSSNWKAEVSRESRTWLVTGAAGFIGSHLVETLLGLGQRVVGFDNYSTGFSRNVDAVRAQVGADAARRFEMIDGDLRDRAGLDAVLARVRPDRVLHQGGLGSVSRSMEDPVAAHDSNATGTLNLFWACAKHSVKRVVYASSSSVYGDHPGLPKRESETGQLLSPYAATKAMCETYANLFSRVYGLETIGLRYFNVFGERQDPNGPYAAVIPRWIEKLAKGEDLEIYGDGETSRDFCFVENVVQANLRGALTLNTEAFGRAFNVAAGERTTLNQLAEVLKAAVHAGRPGGVKSKVIHRDFRPGDIRHSLADLSEIRTGLGYEPEFSLKQGIQRAVPWYLDQS